MQDVKTMGFWGEALNAIALNSKLTVISNSGETSNLGYKAIFIKGEMAD